MCYIETMQNVSEHDLIPLARFLEPVGRCLNPEVARGLLSLRADATMQERLDELADKSTAGTLTDAERVEYEAYVHAVDFISILQAHARRLLAAASPRDTA